MLCKCDQLHYTGDKKHCVLYISHLWPYATSGSHFSSDRTKVQLLSPEGSDTSYPCTIHDRYAAHHQAHRTKNIRKSYSLSGGRAGRYIMGFLQYDIYFAEGRVYRLVSQCTKQSARQVRGESLRYTKLSISRTHPVTPKTEIVSRTSTQKYVILDHI